MLNVSTNQAHQQTHLCFGWYLCDDHYMKGDGKNVELVINHHALGTGGQGEDEPLGG